MIQSLYYCEMPFFFIITGNIPFSEVHFDIDQTTPAFFHLLFTWLIFSHPLSLI